MRTLCNCPTMENQPALSNYVAADDPDVQHERNKTTVRKKLSEMTLDEYLAFNAQAKVFSRKEYHNLSQTHNLTEVINNAKSKDPELQLWAFSVLRKIIPLTSWLDDSLWQTIVEANILKRLVYFLDRDELPQLQFEAVGIISMFSKYSKHITDIVGYGAVAGLADLLNSPIELIRTKAIKTLANIAKESVIHCKVVTWCVALEPLLPEFSTACNLKHASWVLRLFCDRKPQLKSDTVKQLLVVIEHNLHSRNEEILVDTCWTLVSLCEVDTNRRQVVINSTVCRKLIELSDHKSPLIVEPALETLAKVTTGDQMAIEHIIDFGMLPRLVRILHTKYDNNMKNGACNSISSYNDSMKKNVCKTASEFDKNMKKNVCMMISGIANSGGNQIQEVVGCGFVYMLADLFEISDMDLKMEVARTISIITSNCTNQALRFVGEKCVKPLCDMLDCSDKALISMCLSELICILKAWESNTEKVTLLLKRIRQVHGLKKIRNLVYDDDIVVSDTAKEILGMSWPPPY